MPGESIKELRKICQPNPGRSWTETADRKFSIYITWVVIRLPVSANHVTLFSIFLAFLSMLLIIVSDNIILWIAALIAYFFALAMDYVDGEVARYHKISSLSGLLFDRLAGALLPCFLFLGVMYKSFSLNGGLLSVTLGILALLSVYVPRLTISSMYQTAVEGLMKSSNVTGTEILTKSSAFTTLDQFAERESLLKQIAWYMLGHGMIIFLFGCFASEQIAQNDILPLVTQMLAALSYYPGFFLDLFLFYYGIVWLTIGIIYSYNIFRKSETEGLYSHIISSRGQDDRDEESPD